MYDCLVWLHLGAIKFFHPPPAWCTFSYPDVGDISCAAAARLKNINSKSWQHWRRSMLRLQIPAECERALLLCRSNLLLPCICIIHGVLLIYILFVYFRKCAQEINWKFWKVATPPTDRYSRFLEYPRDFLHTIWSGCLHFSYDTLSSCDNLAFSSALK